MKSLLPSQAHTSPTSGIFKNAAFRALVQNNSLALDIPGQKIFELKEPDARRPLCLQGDTIRSPSLFKKDKSGRVYRMTLHQAGYTFEMPRRGVAQPIEIPLEDLQKYCGFYKGGIRGETFEILIQNNHLAFKIPEGRVIELRPPDETGRRYTRISEQSSVLFDESQESRPGSFIYKEDETELHFKRSETEEPDEAINHPDISALRSVDERLAAFKKAGPIRLEGTVKMPQSGIEGTLVWHISGFNRYHLSMDFGRHGHMDTIVNGDRGWYDTSYFPQMELKGRNLELARQHNPALFSVTGKMPSIRRNTSAPQKKKKISGSFST